MRSRAPAVRDDACRRWAATVIVAGLVGGLTTAAWADTASEIARAESDLTELQDRAERLARQIEENWARQAVLEEEVATLSDARAVIEADFASARSDLEDTAIRLYMEVASGDGVSAMLSTDEEIYAATVHYLSTVASDSEAALDRLRSVAAELDRRSVELGEAIAEQRAVEGSLTALAADVTEALAAQNERLEELEALRAAELAFLATSTTTTTTITTTTAPTTTTTVAATTSSAPVTTSTSTTTSSTTTTSSSTTTSTAPTTTTTIAAPTGGGACPVAGAVTFVDSWGAPRSGGRAHQGVDMISARGTPIVAVYGGTIRQASTSTLGGITIWIASDAGDEFYYAHLDGYAEGIAAGVHVTEGQVIGFNGSTGNAPDYLPHLHFEFHPGGGAAVNPYPLVASLCG